MTWLRSRLFVKRESGQGTIEYLGVAVLISVLIASLAVAPVAPKLGTAIAETVCKVAQPVLGGSCSMEEQEPTEEDYMTECPVWSQTKSHSSSADIAFVTLGGGMSLKITKMSDGTAEVELVGEETVGVNAEAAKAKFNDWVKLNAGAGLNITGSMGDTWTFDNWEDAEAFAKANEGRVDSGWNDVPMAGPLANKTNQPGDPRKSTYAVDFSTWAEGAAGIDVNNGKKKAKEKFGDKGGSGNKGGSDSSSGADNKGGSGNNKNSGNGWKSDDYDPEGKTDLKEPGNVISNLSDINKFIPKGSVAIDQTKQGAMEIDRGDNLDDPSDDKTTFIFDLKNSGDGSVKGLGFDAGGNLGNETSMALTTDADGNVIGMKMMQSAQGGGGTGGAKDDNTSKVFVADFDLSDPQSRETVSNFLQNPGGIPSLEDLANGKLIGSTPEQKAMADYLNSPNVKLNDMTMKNTTDSDGLSFGVKFMGLGLGYDNQTTTNTSELTDAHTWVPDGQGGRKRVPNTKCQ